MFPNSRSVVKTHERSWTLIRCNSGVDGIVRMKEGENRCNYGYPCPESMCVRGFFIIRQPLKSLVYDNNPQRGESGDEGPDQK